MRKRREQFPGMKERDRHTFPSSRRGKYLGNSFYSIGNVGLYFVSFCDGFLAGFN